MTYEDFLKTFIEENKDKVSRDRLFVDMILIVMIMIKWSINVIGLLPIK